MEVFTDYAAKTFSTFFANYVVKTFSTFLRITPLKVFDFLTNYAEKTLLLYTNYAAKTFSTTVPGRRPQSLSSWKEPG